MKLDEAQKLSKELLSKLKPHVNRADIVGSISRGHAEVRDIDIVVSPKPGFRDALHNIGLVPSGGDKMITMTYGPGVSVNMWTADKKSYEPTRMHFRLGKNIIRVKADAKKRGLKLTRHGLFKDSVLIANRESDINHILKTDNFKQFIREKQYPRETTNFYRFRQEDPKEFVDFRMKKLPGGSAFIIGKKKDGTWGLQSVMIKKIKR